MSSKQDHQEFIEQSRALARSKAFLGREFLLWLWKKIDDNRGEISLSDQRLKARLWLDDRLVLTHFHTDQSSLSIKGSDPTRSLEAAVGLQSGKSVKELKFGAEINGVGPITFVLGYDPNAHTNLTPKSLKIPPTVVEDHDELQLVEARLGAIENTIALIDVLFSEFIDERSASDWTSTKLQNLQRWVKNRPIESQSNLH